MQGRGCCLCDTGFPIHLLYNRLERELQRAKEVGDIASEQAASLSALEKKRSEELSQLREALRIHASKSEDNAIIGRMQHELLSIKVFSQPIGLEYLMSVFLIFISLLVELVPNLHSQIRHRKSHVTAAASARGCS